MSAPPAASGGTVAALALREPFPRQRVEPVEAAALLRPQAASPQPRSGPALARRGLFFGPVRVSYLTIS